MSKATRFHTREPEDYTSILGALERGCVVASLFSPADLELTTLDGKEGADPEDRFSLEVSVDGVTTMLAEDERIADVAAEPFAIAVARIEILPGSERNQVSVGRRGVVPVAILGTESFDAGLVDPDSLTFGATGDEASLRQCGGLVHRGVQKIHPAGTGCAARDG